MGLLKQIVSCNKTASVEKEGAVYDGEKLPPLLEEKPEETDPDHETDL